MSNIDSAAQGIANVFRPLVKGHADALGRDLAAQLYDAGLLAAEPIAIRTVEELEALDPSTTVTNGPMIHAAATAVPFHKIGLFTLPAVVIATGDQVRAARQALEEA